MHDDYTLDITKQFGNAMRKINIDNFVDIAEFEQWMGYLNPQKYKIQYSLDTIEVVRADKENVNIAHIVDDDYKREFPAALWKLIGEDILRREKMDIEKCDHDMYGFKHFNALLLDMGCHKCSGTKLILEPLKMDKVLHIHEEDYYIHDWDKVSDNGKIEWTFTRFSKYNTYLSEGQMRAAIKKELGYELTESERTGLYQLRDKYLKSKNMVGRSRAMGLEKILGSLDDDDDISEGLWEIIEIAQTYLDEGEYELAAKNYEDFISQIEDDDVKYAARRGLAICYRNLDRFEDSFEILEDLKLSQPDDPILYLHMAMMYEDMDEFDLALEYIERAIEYGPQFEHWQERMDRYKAKVDGNEEFDDDDPNLHLDKAEKLFMIDEYELAALEYEKFIDAFGDDPVTLPCRLSLAVCYRKMQRNDEAFEILEALQVEDPSNPYIYYQMALILEDIGDLTQSLKHIDKTIELHPDPDMWGKFREMIKEKMDK